MSSGIAITKGFILPDGTVAKNGLKHDDIAMDYICNMKMLERYEKSRYKNLCDFMVFDLGAIKVGCSISKRSSILTFVESKMNRQQWEIIEYYMEEGYKLDSL